MHKMHGKYNVNVDKNIVHDGKSVIVYVNLQLGNVIGLFIPGRIKNN
jgi:hypothetical protein